MTLTIPTAKEIFERINTDVINELNTLDPYIRLSFLRSINTADSNAFYELYKTVETIIDLYMDDTTSGEYLRRKAAILGITPSPATVSTGNIVFTGVDGTTIPSGVQLSTDDGLIYQTTESGSISDQTLNITTMTRAGNVVTVETASNHNLASSITVAISGANETDYNGSYPINVTGLKTFTYSITATPTTPATGTITAGASYDNIAVTSVDYGSSQNKDSGVSMSLINQISGVDSTAYVDHGEITGGSDIETDDSLRDRYLFRLKNTPANFNKKAIEQQAKLINGVTRVWVQGSDDYNISITASSLTRSGDYLAIFNYTDHGLYNGQSVTISGADQVEYNLTQVKVLRIDKDNFGYIVSDTPTTPATGTITATFPIASIGQSRIFFTRDNDASIIPTGDEITSVYNKILEIKPVAMSPTDIIVDAPTPVTVDFTFTELTPNSVAMQSAITESLKSYFLSNTDVNKTVRQIDYNSIINSVIDTGGNPVESFTLSSPSGDIAIGVSSIPILGTITYP